MPWRLRILLLTGICSSLAAAGDIHKWVDSQGQVHFGDEAPRNTRSQVVTVKPNVYAAPGLDRSGAVDNTRGVVLYGTTWCGYCKQARRYFQTRNIAYTEYDVETSVKGRADYARLHMSGVPVILAGGRRLNGFSPESFEELMRGANR